MTGTIPRFEREVIEADARRRGGDMEKVATTSLTHHVVSGIRLTSRYQKASEMEMMARAITDLPGEWRTQIVSLDCDSKHQTYSMKVRDGCDAITAKTIGSALSRRIVNWAGCCAGIYITGRPGLSVDIEGDYGE